MKKFIGLSAALLVAGAVLFSCSNGSSSDTSDNSGDGSGSTGDVDNEWTIPVGIEITVDISDIIVTKTENGNDITFEAEVCDSYHWLLGETEISSGQSCMLDISMLENGTYSLSLEAQKSGRWYSYFAQITVNK